MLIDCSCDKTVAVPPTTVSPFIIDLCLCIRCVPQISLVFDFLGALVLGRVTQSVVQGDIANPDVFKREPEIYAYGMMIVMFMSAVWQGIGCYYGWNVSGGHSLSASCCCALGVNIYRKPHVFHALFYGFAALIVFHCVL